MKNRNRFVLLFSVSAVLFVFGCWGPGSEGEFGEGDFLVSCVDMLPSLCDDSPLPPLAVGTDIEIYYEHNRRGYLGEVYAVSEKLFHEPAWSAFYCGNSTEIFDFTRIESEAIEELSLVSTAASLNDPIEVGCDPEFPLGVFVTPIGTSGRRLMGIGDWDAAVSPDIVEVTFDGNEILLTSLNDTGNDLAAILTLSAPDGSAHTNFDLFVCTPSAPAEEPVETVEEESDAAEAPDIIEEDAAPEEDMIEEEAPDAQEDIEEEDASSEEV